VTWSLARRKPEIQIPSPPPQHRRSKRRQPRGGGLTACCGRSTAASSSRSPVQEARSDQANRPWPHMMTTERSRHLAVHPARLPTGNPRTHAAYLGWPRGRPSHRLTTSHNDGRVQANGSLAQRCLRSLDPPVPTSRSWTRRASTPTPAIPARGCLPHRRPPRPHPGRTRRTRERTDTGRPHRTPDTGRRTPGRSDAHTGLWTPVAWTDKPGDWTSAPDTGRRPLAEDVDTLTKARPASAPPGPPRPAAALGHPTVSLWTVPAALGDHDGSAVGPSASARLPAALPGSCSVAPPAKPRLGALLSSDDFGSSVKRTAKLHPLWQEGKRGSGLLHAERGWRVAGR
jgi:hypothetical protein